MNKNWIIFLFAFLLVIEYKTGYKKTMIVDDNFKIKYPTTVIKRGHNRTYIDMRRVKKIYKIKLEDIK